MNIKFENNFDKALKQMMDFTNNLTKEQAEKVIEKAKDRTPVDTGKLKEGYRLKETKEGIRIENEVDYWGFVEYGTSTQKANNSFNKSWEEMINNLEKDLKNK